MNKRILSSVIIAIIATLALLPSAPIPNANAQTGASLSVTPTVTPGNPGDVFTVTVLVDQVANLVAYDVQLHYNGGGISASTVDFSGPFAGSGCSIFPVVESANDAVGTIRAAVTTFSGCTVQITGPTPVFVVTFTVVARQSSPLHISTDSDCACSALAQLMGGSVLAVAHTTSDGNFFAEPNIVFQKTFNVTSVPRRASLVSGAATVTFESGLILRRGEILPGFAWVVFDIITPSGKDITLISTKVFMLPGDTPTVSATATFSELGTYEMFGTIVRGSSFLPGAIVPFETLTGQTFRVTK